jgi:hypothetical protein
MSYASYSEDFENFDYTYILLTINLEIRTNRKVKRTLQRHNPNDFDNNRRITKFKFFKILINIFSKFSVRAEVK